MTNKSPLPIAIAGAVQAPGKERVLCAADFTERGRAAVDVAAVLARCLHQRLTILHAINEPSRTALPADVRESLALFERKYLHDELERVESTGVPAEEDIRAGKPDE